ncbi:hypothetical protein OG905_09240 [Streptomyces sp. NBC_00322]|uniref:ATP-binding protein n=1 Tax=Streptomyces sp. NBC_00322 TaxID=2975712 RepID=UPI002E2A2E45|nr:hypothetical protein [Streptomyces sp. NBC_00322]
MRAPAAFDTAGLALRRIYDARASRELVCHARAVPEARRFIRQTLATWQMEDTDTAQLLVSELVTNAVPHAAWPVVLTVTIRGTVLRCAVADADWAGLGIDPSPRTARLPEPGQ